MRSVFTVDVEDWYHDAEGLGGRPLRDPEPRVEPNLLRILDLLDRRGATGTFFFLGELAEARPDLVRETHRRGHEIASHGLRHRPIRALLIREFRDDVRRSVEILSNLIGEPVRGFRAPYFSLKAGVRAPIAALREAGVGYDSSILPIDRPPGLELVTPRFPYRLDGGLWEVPIAVSRIGGLWHLPVLGGFGLRTLPLAFLRRALTRFTREIGPAVVHLHPWEFDAGGDEAASVPAPIRRLKQLGRAGLEEKLDAVLRLAEFRSIRETWPELATE